MTVQTIIEKYIHPVERAMTSKHLYISVFSVSNEQSLVRLDNNYQLFIFINYRMLLSMMKELK